MKRLIYILLIFVIIFFGFFGVCLAQDQYDIKKEVIPPLQYMWNWFIDKLLWGWDKVYPLLSTEVEKRKPGVEEEFKKETEELKQEAQETLWERLKDLIH